MADSCGVCGVCGANDRMPKGRCRPCQRTATQKYLSTPNGQAKHRARSLARATEATPEQRAKVAKYARERRKRLTPEQREAIRVSNREYSRTPEEKARRAVHSRKKRYGLTGEQQRALFDAQGGRCANLACPEILEFRSAHLEHNHETGLVRGFTCRGCNLAIGGLKDSPARARGLADYLEKHEAKS